MKDDLQKLFRKNKISARLFLISVFCTFAFTLAVVFFFMMLGGLTSIVIGSMVEVGTGGAVKPANDDPNGFLFISGQLWAFWLMCFVASAGQLTAYILMKTRHRGGRAAGIAAFIVTGLTFPPVLLLQIYSFAFLVGNQGKYFYQYLIKQTGENNFNE